ncbi:DUF5360 family protein [Paenibacillus sp. J22TS3]|uniref:DUF5360 family protein n=1 Tax=Paenibacillus sp. J22TS3 TaxID=2807192 RepID=UPI001B1CE970|nr:DUF5360 family protein [Paenibacillus sp. J22TS3]GIP24262.1 hypothetical protein J22TS3_45370 [Paenibacillus sp. J22TS3]
MNRYLKCLMWFTDVGFIVYWTVVLLGVIPEEYKYKDYQDELMVSWNLSFLPLDLFISLTGLLSMYYLNRSVDQAASRMLAVISLSLTFCSGLQAVAFWGIRGDYDLLWWLPNLFLMVYPLVFLPGLICSRGIKEVHSYGERRIRI